MINSTKRTGHRHAHAAVNGDTQANLEEAAQLSVLEGLRKRFPLLEGARHLFVLEHIARDEVARMRPTPRGAPAVIFVVLFADEVHFRLVVGDDAQYLDAQADHLLVERVQRLHNGLLRFGLGVEADAAQEVRQWRERAHVRDMLLALVLSPVDGQRAVPGHF